MNLQTWIQSRQRRAAIARLRREFAGWGFNLGGWADAEVEAALRRVDRADGAAAFTADEAGEFLGMLMKGERK